MGLLVLFEVFSSQWSETHSLWVDLVFGGDVVVLLKFQSDFKKPIVIGGAWIILLGFILFSIDSQCTVL